MRFGLILWSDLDPLPAFDYLRRAAIVSPHDPTIEISLAVALARLSRTSEADGMFRQATSDGSSYSPAYSAYGQWLFSQTRISEARGMASKAIALDPYDVAGRRTMMDIMAEGHEWTRLRQFADETLRLLPYDVDGQRSLLVANTGLEKLANAETKAQSEPTVDHYLALSVLYYDSQRYEDSINASMGALKINPEQAEAYSNMAAAYHAMGKLDETISALRQAVRYKPDLRSAKSNLQVELAGKEKSGPH
jgi:tetratricopeptide (TPR) repeat protein